MALFLCLLVVLVPSVVPVLAQSTAMSPLPIITGTQRVEVVDTYGTSLGVVHLVNGVDAVVLLPLNDGHDIVSLPVTPAGFTLPSVYDPVVAFVTTDCTGQGYVLESHPADWLATTAAVTAPGHTLWAREAGAVAEKVPLLRSYVNTDCWSWYGPDFWAIRARPVVDLDTLYTPPFRLHVATPPPPRTK